MGFYEDGISVVANTTEIIITDLALEGKRRCSAKDFLNGADKEKLLGEILQWMITKKTINTLRP